jgi:glycosyltransferase involved in cell wall biosynthesis
VSEPRSIALVTDAPYYLDRRAQRTAAVLQSLGLVVTVIDQGVSPEQSRRAALPNMRVISSPIPPGGFQRLAWHANNRLRPLVSYRVRNDWCLSQLKGFKPDLIHLINVFSLEAVSDYCRKRHASFIYETYEYWPEHLFSQEYHLSATLAHHLVEVERSAIVNAAIVITVSPLLSQWYRNNHKAQDIAEVLNVPPDGLPISTSTAMHSPLRLVHSGNVIANRNINTIIQALQFVPGLSLVIQGEGTAKNRLRRLSKRLCLEGRIRFKDSVNQKELSSSLSYYDLGLFTPDVDTMQAQGALSNKIFDYMAAGLGIVAFRTSALAALPDIDKFAVLVDEPSVDALASALNELAHDPERVSAMKSAALKASADYTDEQQRTKLAELYRTLLGRV